MYGAALENHCSKCSRASAVAASATIYAEAYGVEEPVAELVPAMLASFLKSDRGFVRERDARLRGQK